MDYLQASIALALFLASMATLCTVLIEILHRIAGLRSKGLIQMLEAYYKNVLTPQIGQMVTPELRADLFNKLTQSALLEQLVPPDRKSWLTGLWRKRLLQVTSVSVEDFMRRLPDTEIFKLIDARDREEAQKLLQRLADRYDEYGDAARDYFKRRAQLLSLLMGVAMAVVANIDALRLYDAFVRNPELAAKVEMQAAALQAQMDAEKIGAASVTTEINNLRKAVVDYKNMGVPIGWGYYPYTVSSAPKVTTPAAVAPPVCNAALLSCDEFVAFISWLLTVTFTGILIGLGGPFWFDLAMQLSQIRRAFGGAGPAVSPRDSAISAASDRVPVAPSTAGADSARAPETR